MASINKSLSFLAACSLGVVVAFAASTFDPASQPLGYIAPAAVSSNEIADGAVAYLPKLDVSDFTGDLISANFLTNGSIDLLNPNWSFAEQVDAQDWNIGRYIITRDKDGDVVPFRKSTMDGDAVKLFKDDEEKRINYLRGDRSEEGDKFRTRSSVVGHIVHSNPFFLGPPHNNYAFDGYEAFKNAYEDRRARLFVGANSGMLHAIDAASGNELFAYVPRPVYSQMKLFADDSYALSYAVDGPITIEDAYFSSSWHTVLVGGLGAGGRGIYALDVTSDSAITNESLATNGAGRHYLWEFTQSSFGGDNLGYTYSRPSIVQLQNGVWAAVIGNGYMSDSGRATLIILDIRDGSVIKELIVSDSSDNGLSSPTLIDTNGDYKVDYAYAGDLNGNLWKFDLSDANMLNWTTAYSNTPLMVAKTSDAMSSQPITTAVNVGRHPEGGFVVYAATGRLLSTGDTADITEQAIYAIRDDVEDILDLPYGNSDVLAQTMATHSHSSSLDPVRTVSDHTPDWETHKGWRLSLDVFGGIAGERVIQDIALRNGRVVISSMNPVGNGANWLTLVNSETGGAPDEVVFDLNNDGEFTVADNVDGNGDGSVEEIGADRVIGLYKGTGLASRAASSRIDDGNESLVINRLISIAPTYTPPSVVAPPGSDDYGLIGGHMDLDVSSRTYPIDGGATDNHDHEWDNEYGNIVDFFEIDTMGGFRAVDSTSDYPGSLPSTPFIISLANAGLSPGAILEINGADFPVRAWQAKVKRYLDGNLNAGEWFPIFKLDVPTSTEQDQGIVQLTSFKMKFFADAILVGGLHPTNTGCVKGNDPSPNGEYRNGALTTQILDASGVLPVGSHVGAKTPVLDPVSGAYEGNSFAIHGTMNYAVPPSGTSHGVSDGLHWESTLFWHWSGGCYNADNVAAYAEDWADEVGTTDDRNHDDPPGTGNFLDPFIDTDPPEDPGPNDPGTTADGVSDHSADTTNIPSLLDSGRLFWREWVPDND